MAPLSCLRDTRKQIKERTRRKRFSDTHSLKLRTWFCAEFRLVPSTYCEHGPAALWFWVCGAEPEPEPSYFGVKALRVLDFHLCEWGSNPEPVVILQAKRGPAAVTYNQVQSDCCTWFFLTCEPQPGDIQVFKTEMQLTGWKTLIWD